MHAMFPLMRGENSIVGFKYSHKGWKINKCFIRDNKNRNGASCIPHINTEANNSLRLIMPRWENLAQASEPQVTHLIKGKGFIN